MTFPDLGGAKATEPMSADVRISSPVTTPGCPDEERCLTEPLASGRSLQRCRQKWGVTPRWHLVPIWTITLSLIQILIFIFADQSAIRALRFEPSLRWQAYRFFSYALVHWGAIHLALNVLVQCVINWPLEVEQGGLRTTSVYLGGGVFGALGACVLQPQPMLGASAGIYAVLISHLAHLYLNFSSLKYKLYRIFSVCVLAGSDIIFCIFHTRSEGYPSISLSAHALGGFAGLLLGLLVYHNDVNGKEMQLKVVRLIAFIITVALLIVGITLVCLLPSKFFRR